MQSYKKSAIQDCGWIADYIVSYRLLFDHSNHLGRNASHNGVVGDIFSHHGTGGHNGVLADGDTRQYRSIGTNPGVFLDDDGLGEQGMSCFWVFGMVF